MPTALTLIELAQRTGDSNIMEIAEVLDRSNPILGDIPIRQSTDQHVEQVVRRNSLPTGAFRGINEGVDKEASETSKVNEPISLLEARSNQDEALVDMAPNPVDFRRTEDEAFIEGLGQTMASNLFYGNNAVDPNEFSGFAARQDSILADEVYDNGGSGSDLTSIYVVQWGFKYVYGVVPRFASITGLAMRDLGVRTVLDADSKELEAYVSLFQWRLGLAVKDSRAMKRVANIETSGSTNTFDEDLLIEALNDLPNDRTDAVIYVNRTVKTQMDIAAKDHNNIRYGLEQFGGVPTLFFSGVPVRRVDAIVSTEDAIT